MSRKRRVILYVVLLAGSVVLLFPLWWMIVLSLSTETEARAAMSGAGFAWWPPDPQWQNYPEALRAMGSAPAEAQPVVVGGVEGTGPVGGGRAPDAWLGFKDALANSVVITSLCVVGNILSCSLAGFALARLRFRGSRALLLVTLATMMLPAQVTMVPLFLLFKALGWIDTILPLVVPAFFGTAFFIFMFRQFFRTIPESVLEAGRLDGASSFGIWWRLMLPIARPAVAITAIFTFIWTWNDFMNPLIFLHSPEHQTLSLALNSFKSQHGGIDNAHLLMAASVVTMLPCVLLFFAAQRYFVQGLNLGAVKG